MIRWGSWTDIHVVPLLGVLLLSLCKQIFTGNNLWLILTQPNYRKTLHISFDTKQQQKKNEEKQILNKGESKNNGS